MTAVPRATGLLVGYAADVLFGDPARWHPVAGFGRVAQRLESMTYADSRGRGVVFVLGCVAPVALLAAAAERSAGRWRAALIAAATWTVLGGTGLRREALALADALAAGDLVTARRRLPSLCGRDPDGLDAAELARATVESLAENTADAVVAPLLWGAVAGIPGLLAYRTVNTLDAMVGHRSARYHRFGWAAARLDDLANLAPARLTALLTVAVAPLTGADAGGAWHAWRCDGGRHPSPNGGQCEAAFAGALGLRLGGRNFYAGRVEDHPMLGTGRPAAPGDITRVARLAGAVSAAAAVTAATLAAALDRRPA